MQNDSSNRVLFRQEAWGTGPNGPTIEYDIVWTDIEILRQVKIDSLNVFIQRLVSRQTPIALSKASILIDYAIDVDLLQKVGL